jgi:NADPH2:quinone reductase
VPIIPHQDGAGVIEAVGDGIDASRVGERVWLYTAQWQRSFGTCAEFIALPSELALHLPDDTSFEEGACLGVPAMTAYHAVTINGPISGKSVMVTGGAGAVGHYAIQIAKLLGASKVIATISSDEKARHAKDAGADVTINYREEDVPARVMEATDGKGADHYIEVDLHGNAKMLPHVCAFGGYVVIYGSNKPEATLNVPEFFFRHLKMEGFGLYFLGKDRFAEVGNAINDMLENKQLKHRIAATYKLDDVAQAHEDVEFGKVIGNVVVLP